jgi:type I restriction enzyme S subunit
MKAGWRDISLGELCRIRTGKKDVNEGNPSGKYPFFTCAEKHTYSDVFSFDTEALLIAGNGNVGNISYYNGKFEAYQRTYVLSDFRGVIPKYIYLILEGKLKETLSGQKLGNTMPYIKMGMLSNFTVPIPPLPEQQRIVSILDEAFEGISTAVENAEQNLINARELFESHLESVFANRGEGWVKKPISQCFKVRSGDFLPAREMANYGDFDVYGGNGFIGKHNKGNISGENVIIGRVGAKCGNVRQVSGDIWVTDNAFYISQFLCEFDLEFLAHSLVRKNLRSTANQAAQPVISYTTIKDVVLEFPVSKSIQKRISDGFRDISVETQRLESIYQQKLSALDELKKSILHQAFSGQLN